MILLRQRAAKLHVFLPVAYFRAFAQRLCRWSCARTVLSPPRRLCRRRDSLLRSSFLHRAWVCGAVPIADLFRGAAFRGTTYRLYASNGSPFHATKSRGTAVSEVA